MDVSVSVSLEQVFLASDEPRSRNLVRGGGRIEARSDQPRVGLTMNGRYEVHSQAVAHPRPDPSRAGLRRRAWFGPAGRRTGWSGNRDHVRSHVARREPATTFVRRRSTGEGGV